MNGCTDNRTGGYQWHLDQGERPCTACRDARNAYDRARMANRPADKECACCGRLANRLRRKWCNTCHSRWSRAGRPDSGPPPSQRDWAAKRENLAELIARGEDVTAAAGRVGITVDTARRWLSEPTHQPPGDIMSTAWITEAACRGVEPELFFPDGEVDERMPKAQVDAAMAVCRSCPVATDCFDWAMERRDLTKFGVWSGTLPKQRERYRAERRAHERQSA